MNLTAIVRTIGLRELQAKVVAADANILIHNRSMLMAMLSEIKTTVSGETPIGPGHFGYHLRDRYITDISSKGVRSTGVLKAPPQGYWREYGTLGHRRIYTSRSHKITRLTAKQARSTGFFGGGGEPALMIAHKALSSVRKFINFYYGGMAAWWRA